MYKMELIWINKNLRNNLKFKINIEKLLQQQNIYYQPDALTLCYW